MSRQGRVRSGGVPGCRGLRMGLVCGAGFGVGMLVLGCGDEQALRPGDRVELTPDRAAERVVDLFAPALAVMDLGPHLALVDSVHGTGGCLPAPGCAGGSATLCPTLGGAVLTWSACAAQGSAWSGITDFSGDGAAGTARLEVDGSGSQVRGTLVYLASPATGCVNESFTGLAVADAEGLLHLAGSVTYCDTVTTGLPVGGDVSGTVRTLDDQRLGVNLKLLPQGRAEILVFTRGFGTRLLTCTADLAAGRLECEEEP